MKSLCKLVLLFRYRNNSGFFLNRGLVQLRLFMFLLFWQTYLIFFSIFINNIFLENVC